MPTYPSLNQLQTNKTKSSRNQDLKQKNQHNTNNVQLSIEHMLHYVNDLSQHSSWFLELQTLENKFACPYNNRDETEKEYEEEFINYLKSLCPNAISLANLLLQRAIMFMLN